MEKKCSLQCDHCKKYYKPLEDKWKEDELLLWKRKRLKLN